MNGLRTLPLITGGILAVILVSQALPFLFDEIGNFNDAMAGNGSLVNDTASETVIDLSLIMWTPFIVAIVVVGIVLAVRDG